MRTVFVGVLTILASGCGADEASLALSPKSIDWGWVDFHADECMNCECTEGCAMTELVLNNVGQKELNPSINAFDADHICIEGFDGAGSELGEMQPGSTFVFKISVCGYEAGELNIQEQDPATPVEGSIGFSTGDEEEGIDVNWSFVPYREQGGQDTAQ